MSCELSVAQDLIPEDKLASSLLVSVRTLKRWAQLREGPPVTKIGRKNFYREQTVREWIIAQERVLRSPPRRKAQK